MKPCKTSRGEVKSYSSFEELGKSWGLKPHTKQTKDKKKLENQRESFCKRHLCPACKEPMSYLEDSNIMCCQNENCEGLKYEMKNNETGEIKYRYEIPFHTLDSRGAEIAANIFAELN